MCANYRRIRIRCNAVQLSPCSGLSVVQRSFMRAPSSGRRGGAGAPRVWTLSLSPPSRVCGAPYLHGRYTCKANQAARWERCRVRRQAHLYPNLAFEPEVKASKWACLAGSRGDPPCVASEHAAPRPVIAASLHACRAESFVTTQD
jgi:hypothetical protein